jgi:uncharacterized protein YihD (DUF1040 family)
MKISTDILEELKAISPQLAALERVNPFTVPEGYFDGFAAGVLASVKEEETTLISSFSNEPSFEVPQGYFDSLADNIIARIKAAENELAADELKKLSPVLSGIQNSNVFEVPLGYFDGLADNIMAHIKAEQTETASDELRKLSPMLYSIQNENVFTVPKGYFEGLSDNILARVKPQARVVNMNRRGSSILKYAVAAVFTGVMALGVFKLTDTGKSDVENTIIAEGTQIAKENKFDEELAKITDDDIVKYLEATGTDVNAAVVANSIDNNELPSQDEYLLDEQALDKYLNSINVDDTKN